MNAFLALVLSIQVNASAPAQNAPQVKVVASSGIPGMVCGPREQMVNGSFVQRCEMVKR